MHCGTHPEPVKGLSAESKISCRWLRANSTRPSKDSLSAPLPYKLATCSAQTQSVSEKQCQRQCMIKGSAQASQASYSSMAAEACQDVDQHGLLLGRKRLTTCRAWSLVMHWCEHKALVRVAVQRHQQRASLLHPAAHSHQWTAGCPHALI